MTAQRKKDHVDICIQKNVESGRPNYFDEYRFKHQALPEISLDKIDLKTTFLDKNVSAPIIISSMTGGYDLAGELNKNLAIAAEKMNLPLCLGSMRVAIESPETISSFQVRNLAPSIPILANLGAVQLNHGYTEKELRKIVNIAGANGLIFHLNPLQEAIQPEGDTDFIGLLDKLRSLDLPFPLIIKEVGCGISGELARKLDFCEYIDTAGSGGTSWAAIEGFRRGTVLGEVFRNWGIPTPVSIQECSKAGAKVIGSGGIRTGIDVAKSIALGSEVAGIALPLLEAAKQGPDQVCQILENFIKELRITMFCIGVKNIDELRNSSSLNKI